MLSILNTRLKSVLTFCLIVFLLACSDRSGQQTYDLVGHTMGTTWSVRLVQKGELAESELLRAAIEGRLEELNARLSTYIDSSEVSRFGAHDGTNWFSVSADTYEVVRKAIEISELSDGAFDITIGPLVDLWGFGASGPRVSLPAQADIDNLLANIGHTLIEVRELPMAVRKMRAAVQIDLSAIAKGYAVDEIARLLDGYGFPSYMVEIGGEVRTRGSRADGQAWRIAIEDPDAEKRAVQRILPLRNLAVATSGDYRNFFDYDGKRYTHTLDPRTGWPVAHNLASVSVISETAMAADALATALLVLGSQKGLDLAVQKNIAASFIVRNELGLQELQSPRFKEIVEK